MAKKKLGSAEVWKFECKDGRCARIFYTAEPTTRKVVCPHCGWDARMCESSFAYAVSLRRTT